MSERAINTNYDQDQQRNIGEMVVGIRIDTLPTGEASRLAAVGRFQPLTTDKDGNLRVVPPDGIKVVSAELEVLLRIEALLIEQRDLLLKIS